MTVAKDLAVVRNLKEVWPSLKVAERIRHFSALPRHAAEELFLSLSAPDQVDLVGNYPDHEIRSWLRFLPPDDAADFIQEFPHARQSTLLELLDERTRQEVVGLLAYAEDAAGGLMNPEYIRLRPDMKVVEAIGYLRAQAHTRVKIYYAYVIDGYGKLQGVVSLRDVLLEPSETAIKDFMKREFISVHEDMHGEDIARLFSMHSKLLAIPVVDKSGKMKGIVTYDDIAWMSQREATEDIQKIGGMEALDAPYFDVSFYQLIKKRGGWLTVLFFGEMFTATAMGYFEDEIARAVVLALFVPLIISSGGNSGSQASTLIIRSLALQEIRLRDWWRVLLREVRSGLVLGAILGSIGFMRILLWQQWSPMYGAHYMLVALTVAFSLVGVVMWGTVSGSMLPFILRRLGFDPASASAPLVATLVDVTGLVIYFSVGSFLLRGTLL
jgi:magnesium transporter